MSHACNHLLLALFVLDFDIEVGNHAVQLIRPLLLGFGHNAALRVCGLADGNELVVVLVPLRFEVFESHLSYVVCAQVTHF